MKVYTAKETAKMLCICTETLRRVVRAGGIQHRRIGRRILFTESDIAAILVSRATHGDVNPYAAKKKENKNEQQPITDNATNATAGIDQP
jgi:excisionase family DNA binding protein